MQVRGALIFDPSDVREAFGLARGAVLIESDLNHHLDRLLRFYEDRGYPFCALHPDVHLDGNGAGVQVAVSPGPLVRIDAVRFKGNAVTREEVLSRHVSVGEVYDQRRVDAFVQRLQNLPFIDRVYKAELVLMGNEMALVIGLEESRHTRIEGGLGLGSGQTLTGTIALDVLNFSGGGREGDALWSRRGAGASHLRVSYREPYVFNGPVSARGRVEMTERVGYVTPAVWRGRRGRPSARATCLAALYTAAYCPIQRAWGFTMPKRCGLSRRAFGLTGACRQHAVGRPRFGGRSARSHAEEGAGGGQQMDRCFGLWAGDPFSRDGRGPRGLGKPETCQKRPAFGWGARNRCAAIGRSDSGEQTRDGSMWNGGGCWGPKTRIFAFVDAGRISGNGTAIWPVSYGIGLLANGRMGAVGIDYGLPWRESPAQGMVHVRMISAF